MTGIFIDLDGTLLNDQGKISQDDLSYLKSIKDKYNIYLSTGLPKEAAKKYYDELGLNTFLISSQGQVIWKDGSNKESTFDKAELEKLLNKYDDIAIIATNGFYSKGDMYKFIRHGKEIIKDPKDLDHIVGVYLMNKEVSNKFDTYGWDLGDGTELSILRPLGSNKESAMQFVIDEDKLDFTIMLGNGRADVKSMKLANVGVAMKNSYKDVLDDADIISEDDNNNSGVSKTLKTLLK